MAPDYLLVAALVFALNLLPAFGPPTSAVLVALTLNFDLETVPLVAVAALAAASGRFVLANLARGLRPRLSPGRRQSLATAQRYLEQNRGRSLLGLALFALSPVPSGQLFVAAGLMEVRLIPLTAAFFAGRLVSYAIYVTGASAIAASVPDTFLDSLTSPLGIAVQLTALAGLVLFLRIDWTRVLAGRVGPTSDAEGDADAEHHGRTGQDPGQAPGGVSPPTLREQLDRDQGEHRAGGEAE